MGRYGDQEQVLTLAIAESISTIFPLHGATGVAVRMPLYSTYMEAASNSFWLQVSNTITTSTFKRLKVQGMYSGTSGIQDWSPFAGVGNVMINLPVAGFDYVRFHFTSAASAAMPIYVHTMQ